MQKKQPCLNNFLFYIYCTFSKDNSPAFSKSFQAGSLWFINGLSRFSHVDMVFLTIKKKKEIKKSSPFSPVGPVPPSPPSHDINPHQEQMVSPSSPCFWVNLRFRYKMTAITPPSNHSDCCEHSMTSWATVQCGRLRARDERDSGCKTPNNPNPFSHLCTMRFDGTKHIQCLIIKVNLCVAAV